MAPRTFQDKKDARRVARGLWLLLVPGAWLWGCGGSSAEPAVATIPRDTFIVTYVDLRRAAVNLDSAQLDSARAAILARHGLTQQDLLTFADVHGSDVDFMRSVWDEVEGRMNETPPDSIRAR